jgi:hypothetical protein
MYVKSVICHLHSLLQDGGSVALPTLSTATMQPGRRGGVPATGSPLAHKLDRRKPCKRAHDRRTARNLWTDGLQREPFGHRNTRVRITQEGWAIVLFPERSAHLTALRTGHSIKFPLP